MPNAHTRSGSGCSQEHPARHPVMAQSPSARVRSLVAKLVSLIVNGETAPDGEEIREACNRVSPIAVILHRL